MLEVCFNDSVKGALSFAQHCENGEMSAPIAVLADKKGVSAFFAKRKALKEYRKKHAALQKQAVSLGGNREALVGISFGFSEGDIQAPLHLADCPRKEYIRSVFSFDRYNEREDMDESINAFWRNCMEDLEKLKSNPSKIRIWLDQTPDAQCGLLFLADLLKDSETEIHIVELPPTMEREDGCIIEYHGWGAVEPQVFETFLDRETVLTTSEIVAFSNRWQLLKAENALLRIVENGVVVSADANYYDPFIRKEFPQDTCKVAYLIGSALSRQKILTGDVFIAKRIQAFITSGELKIVSYGKDGFYRATVCRAK